MRFQTPVPQNGVAVVNLKIGKSSTLGELDASIKLRSSLRCDGIGRLDCAEDTDSGQRLAVRWLPLDANGEAAVKACERLPQHEMLPRIRQTGKMGSMAFLAVDFPEGSLLSTILGDRLDTGVVLQMASQLADAMATVHGQGVVHGEFGSDSVLMVGDKSYLWDLPLVVANRLTDRRGENRLMQNLVRVVPYLAPERARGGGASCEADVYSLGALLCICAGAPMPAESTTLGTVYAIAQGLWRPRVPSTIPAPYHAMIERMISADASQRPAAQDVAKLFSQPMHSGSLPTVPDMPMIRLPPELQARATALLTSSARAPLIIEPVAAPVIAAPAPSLSDLNAMAEPLFAEPVAEASSTDPLPLAEPLNAPAFIDSIVAAPPVLPPVTNAAEAMTAFAVPAPKLTARPEALADEATSDVSDVSASMLVPESELVVAATAPSLAPAVEAEAAPVAVMAEPVGLQPAAADDVPEASQQDVLKLPTVEMPKVLMVESIPSASAPVVEKSSISLSDAVAVKPEDAMPVFGLYTEPEKRPVTMWAIAGAAVVGVVGLIVLGLNLVNGSAPEVKAEAPVTAVVAPVTAPAEMPPAPVELQEVPAEGPPEAPASVTAEAAAPAVPASVDLPKTRPAKFAPAKARSEEMVDMGNARGQDDIAPLARAKAARAAASVSAPKAKRSKTVRAAPPAAADSDAPAAVESMPAATAATPAASSPDDFFEDADLKKPNP